jgi:CubicO group peptidase (beta-lactamase class C family)
MKKRTVGLRVVLAMSCLIAGNLVWASVDGVVAQASAEYMAAPQVVGLSVGVIHAGKSYSYHFGTVSKPDDRTIYPIASLTKTFTGLLLAQAALEKRLSLDGDVRRYLGAGYDNLAYEQQPIRLSHLLSHRSGLPFEMYRNRSELYAGLHEVKLTEAPGVRFKYSNAAAQLAGYILEDAYGQSFEALVKERIARPLGMRDITITLTPEQQTRLVAGYDDKGVRQPYEPDYGQAAGALKASLADMLAYARLQLAETDPAVRLSHQPTYTSDDYAVGLNWQILQKEGRRVIWQDGAVPGFASLLVLHPETGTAIVLLSNELDSQTLGRLRVLANAVALELDQRNIAAP